MDDDLYGCDSHLEMAYEDANGSALPEHLTYEDLEDAFDCDEDPAVVAEQFRNKVI